MSRNRPRGGPGRENLEEAGLWQKVIQDIKGAKELNDQQMDLGQRITALNEKIIRDGNKPSLAELKQFDDWLRELLRLSEHERKMLTEEPSDTIKNLSILTALRTHSEANAAATISSKQRKRKPETDGAADSPGPSVVISSDKVGRLKTSSHRSTSVSSSHARDPDAAEGAKGTAAEKSGQLFVNAEVVFKHNKKQHGMEGEGILCYIKNITGEGTKKRYDVQDPEPIENGDEGAVYKTTAASLIPIPPIGAALPSFPPGTQVLARYPDTTTFYRAEVVGSKKDVYRLRFEGEEDDKEMDVDRRYVLEIPGK